MTIHLPIQEMLIQSLDQEDPLEEALETHSSIVTWETPRTEEPGWLQSIRSQSQTRLSTHTHVTVGLANILISKYLCFLGLKFPSSLPPQSQTFVGSGRHRMSFVSPAQRRSAKQKNTEGICNPRTFIELREWNSQAWGHSHTTMNPLPLFLSKKEEINKKI